MPAPSTPTQSGLPYLRLAILLCPGFTLHAMSGFVDALRLAADRNDDSQQIYFAWEFIAGGPAPVTASCGLEIQAQVQMPDPDRFDGVVVCGGRLEKLAHISPEVTPFLRTMHRQKKLLIGLCTGPFVLAEAGLLDGRSCAVHFQTHEAFNARYPKVAVRSDLSHVVDDTILTCPGGITSAMVASILIRAYSNASRANKAVSYLLLDYAVPQLQHRIAPRLEELDRASALTLRAVDEMEFGIDAPCSIDDLAARLHVSKASLNRAFARDLDTSPSRFWRKLRLLAARELLTRGTRSITEISYETGFADTAHFCASFKREFGMTPGAFQRRDAATSP